ncbi:MAG: hypothetical protein KIG36_00760, partial [Eubacteriales bacterium]|nr:hypothetical protein [Eubacteriales bacterium]
NKNLRRTLTGLQFFAMFMGMYTDYLYLFVILSLYVKRLALGEIPLPWSRKVEHPTRLWLIGTLKTGGASILALLLFVLQVAVNGPVRVLDMFLFRTGLGNGGEGWASWFERKFWQEYMVSGYGAYVEWIMKGVLIGLLLLLAVYVVGVHLKKRPFLRSKGFEAVIAAALLFIVPCFLQVNALRNHSAIHDFSTQKFSLVMSVVPLVFTPLAIWYFIRSILGRAEERVPRDRRAFVAAAAAILLIVSVGYTYVTHTGMKLVTTGGNWRVEYPSPKAAPGATAFACAEQFFPEPTELYAREGRLVGQNTDYYDVVFTNDEEYEVSNIRPQSLSQTMKRVYYVNSVAAIRSRVARIEGDCRICFLDRAGSDNNESLRSLIEASTLKASVGEMYLYTISRADFMALFS